MLKRLFFIISAVVIPAASFAQNAITLEDLWVNYSLYPKGIDEFTSMKDGKSFARKESSGAISRFDMATGNKLETLFTPHGKVTRFDSYSFNADESKILLATETEPIYRHSSASAFFVYDLKNKSLNPVSSKGKQIYPTFSPVGDMLAYIQDNNLWILDLFSGKDMPITFDGKKNEIINGMPDWVYEEEFTMYEAYRWSKDANRLAYLKFNEKDVPSFTMPIYKGNLYPQNEVFKYPKVGERNSEVSLWVYNVRTSQTQKVELGSGFEYIPRFQWVDETGLAVFTMNRLQNELTVYLCDLATGARKIIYTEKSDTYIEITDDYCFMPRDKGFLWVSESDGFRHLYHYDYEGKLINRLTSGNWDITELYGTDTDMKTIFFQSAEVSPLERRVYSIQIDGKKKKDLTPYEGWNSAEFTEGCTFFVHTRSTISTPASYQICDRNGKTVRVLETNDDLKEKLKNLNIKDPEFFQCKTESDVALNGWMIKPADFDPSKKYPVFMYVYGGPGSQTVKNQWGSSNYLWFQMLAQLGYIVVSVDNRGTGARGRDFRASTYRQLGNLETIDQMEAAKWLGKQTYVDKNRIGIFGWSYGGYMSSLCITRGADLFKMAIAVAPVTNWKFYDNIYTERYMGTPETNPNGYDDNAPIKFADRLKGKYLLIHGTADDNVHWQNTAEMTNALVKANKQFDQFIYPDSNHGIYGGNTRYHLYTMMTDYIKRNL